MSGSELIALCLYGRFNNRYSASAGVDGARYIREKILQAGPCHVFIYSNDLASEQRMKDCYGDLLRNAVVEPGPDFGALMAKHGIQEGRFRPIEPFRTAENSLRFLYGRMRSIELMRSEMECNGTQYAAAITCRFDLAQIDRYNGWQPFRVSEINFNRHFDMDYLYSAMWNQLNGGYADQWFFSNPDTILGLADMFHRSLDYLVPGSDYQRFLEGGIPDSNSADEFSNEMLKEDPDPGVKRVRLPFSAGVNNHLLHKYFFIEKGLYERSRFTSDFEGVAHVLHTHSDYSDVWPMYFGQQSKFFSAFTRNYVLVDRYSSAIPRYYEQILYDDSVPYVDRLRQGLALIPEETIFLDHEDMMLFDYPDMGSLLDYSRVVKTPTRGTGFRRGLDFVRLIRGGKYYSVRHRGAQHLRRLLRLSPWIFSIQPSFWKRSRLLDLLNDLPGEHIWDFELRAQETCRRLRIRGGFSSASGQKKGSMHWHNPVYPYIATAIVKGKWNTTEYATELRPLFSTYGIDPSVRGEI